MIIVMKTGYTLRDNAGTKNVADMRALISKAKRSCRLCSAYHNFNPENDYQKEATDALKLVVKEYNTLVGSFRASEEPITTLARAQEKKRKCLDAIEKCRKCLKESDYINRMIDY